MAFAKLTALGDTDLVDQGGQTRLASVGITTVEELASAIRANAKTVAGVLDESIEAVRDLGSRAESRMDDPMKEEFSMPPKRYATGALPPLRKQPSGDE